MRCPKCNSVDTVAYWSIKQPDAPNIAHETALLVMKRYYPNARKCVDCEAVWW